MDFTTGEPSEEALNQLIKSLIEFMILEGLTAPDVEDEEEAVSEEEAVACFIH